MEGPDQNQDPLWEPQTHFSTPASTDPGHTSRTGSEPPSLSSPQRRTRVPGWSQRLPCHRDPWWPFSLLAAEPSEVLWDRTPCPAHPGPHLHGSPVIEVAQRHHRAPLPGAPQHPWPGEPSSPGLGPWSLDCTPPTAFSYLSPYSWYSPMMVAPQMESGMEHASEFHLLPSPLPPFSSSYSIRLETAPQNRAQIHHGGPPGSQRAGLQLLPPCPQTPAMLVAQPDVRWFCIPSVIDPPTLTMPV